MNLVGEVREKMNDRYAKFPFQTSKIQTLHTQKMMGQY